MEKQLGSGRRWAPSVEIDLTVWGCDVATGVENFGNSSTANKTRCYWQTANKTRNYGERPDLKKQKGGKEKIYS